MDAFDLGLRLTQCVVNFNFKTGLRVSAGEHILQPHSLFPITHLSNRDLQFTPYSYHLLASYI